MPAIRLPMHGFFCPARKQPYRQKDENEDEGIEEHIQTGCRNEVLLEQLGIIKCLVGPRNRPLVQLSRRLSWYKLTGFPGIPFSRVP